MSANDYSGTPLAVAAGSAETLHHYLSRNIDANVIDFMIRAQREPGGGVKFYIRPTFVSGDTEDFLLFIDPETGWDMLLPENAFPHLEREKFRAWLSAQLDQSPNAKDEARRR